MSEEITGKTVYFTLDPADPPQMSEDERKYLENLRDEDIDVSDIPPQTGIKNWSRSGLYGGPAGAVRLASMQQEILLLDQDVAELSRALAESARSRMNELLRAHAEELMQQSA